MGYIASRICQTVLLFWLIALPGCSAPPPIEAQVPSGGTTLFEGARLITGEDVPPLENAAFLVSDGRFQSVGKRGEVSAPASAARVNLTGTTVLPALVEMHAHLGYWRGAEPSREAFTRDQLIEDLQRFAYHGVGAVLSLGAGRPEVAYALRDELRAAPRADTALYLTAGQGLAPPKVGPGGPLADAVSSITSESDATIAVGELSQRGVDGWVKMWLDVRRGRFEPAVYSALINEAHSRGLRVVAHTHALDDFKNLLRAGVDGFAHPTWRQTDVAPVDEELLSLFRAHPRVFMVTTLWAFRNEIYGPKPYWIEDPLLHEAFAPEIIGQLSTTAPVATAPDAWTNGPVPRAVKQFKDAGVRFGLGTDMGGGTIPFYGFSSHIEMESLVRAGLSPIEAIRAATRDSALRLGLDQLGTVAPGKSADFIVLNADPLENIANTRRITDVYLRGARLDRPALRQNFARSQAATP